MRLRILIPSLVVCLVACSGEPDVDTPQVSEAFPVIPLPPNSGVVGQSGGQGALLIRFYSTESDSVILEYYRNTFSNDPWVLISDAASPDGSQVLYVERDKQPMWVRIYRASGSPGSMIELSGAVVESDSVLVDSILADSTASQ